MPAHTAVLSGVQVGRIEKLAVKEGDRVNRGDLLFELASDVQRAALELAKAKAESTADLDLAKTLQADAKRRYDRVKKLHDNGAAHWEELDDATSKLAAANIEVELAAFELSQAKRQLAYDQARLAERTVRCPFDGYVVELLKQQGEAVDEVDPVLKLVQIDPLHIQVDCPIQWAGRISTGDEADIELWAMKGPARTGKVIFASKSADAASHTFRVKLEIPNPKHDWIAGVKVWVRFREPSLARRTVPGA
jgi:RND family efflux transporter MFP subunit